MGRRTENTKFIKGFLCEGKILDMVDNDFVVTNVADVYTVKSEQEALKEFKKDYDGVKGIKVTMFGHMYAMDTATYIANSVQVHPFTRNEWVNETPEQRALIEKYYVVLLTIKNNKEFSENNIWNAIKDKYTYFDAEYGDNENALCEDVKRWVLENAKQK